MKRLTCAIVVAGALLAADTTTATIIGSTGGGGSGSLDCTNAAASQGVIWPPDHKMVPETIYGVTTDPSLPDSSITIKITGIQQDEPVDALGSGNTAPDGTGVLTSTAYVRAERGGPGTGRIYFISFDALDSLGDKCSGTVMAYVPHDQGQGFNPVDTGQKYDSTVIPP
jgi:hypothetical protein